MTTKELKQLRYDIAYLKMATEWSQLSHAKRKQVGCLVVRENQIISDGYNGTPTGFDNDCEDENGDTHWYVLHSEANAILKCAKYGDSCDGATIYQTHSPCKECSKLIYQSGIKRLVYVEEYKDSSGIDFLINSGVKIEKVEIT
jgi:dCMP deaminase